LTDKEIHEVIIIGAGPAALSAAIYTTREDIETLILEKGLVGGLAAITETIENYPGFPKGVGGLELAKNLQAQAERFGAKIELGEVTSLRIDDDQKIVTTYMGEKKAKVVLVATGNDYRHIGVKGEEEYMNRGVHYCATCDGPLYKGKKMVVVGGGNSAAQESLFLAKLAESVDILIRKDKWKASEILIKEVENNPKITVHFNTEIQSIEGEQLVNKIKVVNNKTNKESQIKTEAVFVFVGLVPNTQFLAGSGVELDERGFVKTNGKLETNIKGIFCAGDVRSGATEQIASAVGEGANAALAIREYLDGIKLERSYSAG
jgi:thioredoxin reductase (NADPH)